MRNPFEAPKSFASSLTRPDVARIVSGPNTARVMKQLSRRRVERGDQSPSSAQFALTSEERADVDSVLFESLYAFESLRLLAFFGELFEIPPLPPGITPELKEFWEQNGFRLEYWPKVRMSEDKNFPGWKHKPGKRYANEDGIEFFDEVQAIQDLPENKSNSSLKGLFPLDLPGCWSLKDMRAKPNYENGDQTYEDDALFEESLGSRTGKHPSEFNTPDFWTPLAETLRLDSIPGTIIRLPRAIEANVMGQEKGFHDTSTYEWCEEWYGSGKRIISGCSVGGGASCVNWIDYPVDSTGCRPLVVFPSL